MIIEIAIHPCQTSKFQRQRPSFEIIFHLSISDKRKRDHFSSCTGRKSRGEWIIYTRIEPWARANDAFCLFRRLLYPVHDLLKDEKNFQLHPASDSSPLFAMLANEVIFRA